MKVVVDDFPLNHKVFNLYQTQENLTDFSNFVKESLNNISTET